MVQYRADTSEPIHDIPERKVLEGRVGSALIRIEEHLWCVASWVDSQKVAEECHCCLPRLNGNVSPVHDTGQMPTVEQ
jgi:hypothetical protein